MHTTETDYLACLALAIARYRMSGEEAYSSFADAIDSCQELLNQSESLFEVRYALAIARTGLNVCNRSWTEPAGRSVLLEPNLNDYRQALNSCYARGVVERTIKDIGYLRQAGADGLDPILQMLNHALIESQRTPA
jgi:hypothetical protein